jgi:phenylacetate-coenzyme A ligase PaaK-like adenylate-forming protein
MWITHLTTDEAIAHTPWGDLFSPLTYWSLAPAVWDIWLAAAAGSEEIAARSTRRFAEIVQFARERSPYYAGLYRSLPQADIEPRHVPPVTRGSLMERFDDWVTDPDVTCETASAFVADPGRAGRPYLGRYAAWTSSGTTGEPGLFVHDGHALAVYDSLEMLRLGRGLLAPGFLGSLLLAGGRYAMIAATGGHFAGVSSVERMRLLAPALADRLRVFSILEPLPRLIEALNEYQPSFIATYPTAASLLAAEQRAGRLGIRPSAIWLGGETLSAVCLGEVHGAFQCRVLEEYGASECMSIACECDRGALHLNSDWVMLEPVDRDYRPVAPGETSHSVLLTNLANRVQPIIRYDLGDSIAFDPEPCTCGSPFPVLRVEGRSDDVLGLANANGDRVELLPLALTTVVEEHAGAHQFQIIQTAPDALGVRLQVPSGAGHAPLWRKVERALRAFLDTQGLPAVALHFEPGPLERSELSGKLRRVVAVRPG